MKAAAEINPEMIPPPYDEIYAAGGFDALYTVLGLLGGRSVYIPSLRTVLAKCIEAEARKERETDKRATYNGIARKYGYSCRHLKKLINGR